MAVAGKRAAFFDMVMDCVEYDLPPQEVKLSISFTH